MAVAMDLGDPQGNIHPRDKQDVGLRLSLAAQAIAYGDKDVYYTGPIINKLSLSNNGNDESMQSIINFKNTSNNGLNNGVIELRSLYGFEVGCVQGSVTHYLEGIAKDSKENNVLVSFPHCPKGYKPDSIRYAWRDNPCQFKNCSVYSNDLPSPPFEMKITSFE